MFWRIALFLFLACSWSATPLAARAAGTGSGHQAKPSHAHSKADHSSRRQRGKASYYSLRFAGKKTASGRPLNPNSNAAASKTLPLGTKAEVKNLETGKSAVVEIEDRGPYVKGRIIDLTPKTAEQLDMKKDGVAPVEVTPLEMPASQDAKSQAAPPAK